MKRAVLWTLGSLAAVIVIVVMVAAFNRKGPEATDQSVTSRGLVGVSLSPKSFAAGDYLAFFNKAAAVGNALSWAGPWQDLAKSNNAALTVINESKKRRMTPFIITGPANDEVLDGVFRQGFHETVLNFVRANDVPYLGLGNEINNSYREAPERYEAVISTLNQLAKDVKAASPDTKVFTIFQLERLKGLHGGLFGGKNNTADHDMTLLNNLENFDMVAFTTYPCLIYKTPAEIPEKYYTDIANHTDLPVVFSEVGWFRETPVAGWESNEQEQADFIARFQKLTASLKPAAVIWPFLYDQDIPSPFQEIALLGPNQESSPGYRAWQDFTN
jgi:hypothetical protein